MALTQVTGPYPIFTDLDGTPLDDGYLYIGAINDDPETNPIQVFFDSNLTIPATQPIRTNNGYAYRNGTPALLYTAGAFSITIRNKREEFVLYSPLGYGFDPAAVSASVVKNDFTGDGIEVAFALSAAPSTILATNVFINGVYQEKDSYNLLGNTITFSIAPPLSSSVEVMTNETGVINSGNASAISYTLPAPGATAQTVQTKLEQYVSVKDFGAVGDGVTDDTAAIQAAFDAVDINGKSILFLSGATYRITDTVTLQPNNNLDMNGASILYDGTRDRPALVIGNAGEANSLVSLQNLAVRSQTVDWSSIGFVGIRFINLQRSIISISVISSFYIGADFYAEDNYVAYNQVFLNGLGANKISQRLITIGTDPLTFCNENTFYGGSFLQTSATDGLGDAYGVVITWDKISSYRRQNNNVWFRPSFELRQPFAGGSVRDCVLLDGAGESCRFIEARRENSGRAINVNTNNSSFGRNNEFISSFDESNQAGESIVLTGLRGSGNTYLGSVPQERFPSTWTSDDLINYFSSGGAANSYHVAEPFHACSSANGIPVSELTSTNLDLDLTAVRALNASSFGFFLDTDFTKSFLIHTKQLGAGCRIVVRAFDANGSFLNDAGLTNWYVNGVVTSWTTNFGGGYILAADTFLSGMITVLNAVKSVQIILTGGPSVAMLLQSVSVSALNTKLSPRIYSGLARQPNTRRATAKPDTAGTVGSYNQGDFIANASAAVASTSGWTATNNGRLARAWTPTTAFQVGQIRWNDTDKIYVCVTAGTSAGAGGPTGTGTAIADGTVVWNYVSPKSTFATNANLV